MYVSTCRHEEMGERKSVQMDMLSMDKKEISAEHGFYSKISIAAGPLKAAQKNMVGAI
jgi:hypothetical protein